MFRRTIRYVLALAVFVICDTAAAQTWTEGWIDITDPVLKPDGDHIIARHYLLWDGRERYCQQQETARLVIDRKSVV